MPNYFTELKNGPSGPYYKVEDEKATSAIEAIVNKYGACNIFNIKNIYETTGMSESNGVLTNTLADSRDYFELWVLGFYSSSSYSTIVNKVVITENGHYEFDAVVSRPTAFIQLGHNGSSQDLTIRTKNVIPAGNYKFSLDVSGHNPSVVGGLEISNIMIYDARLNPTDYVPYAMTNRELTEKFTGWELYSTLTSFNYGLTGSLSIYINRGARKVRLLTDGNNLQLSQNWDDHVHMVFNMPSSDFTPAQERFSGCFTVGANDAVTSVGAIYKGKSNKAVLIGLKGSPSKDNYVYIDFEWEY